MTLTELRSLTLEEYEAYRDAMVQQVNRENTAKGGGP